MTSSRIVRDGFTIVELLIVIVVIAILASITVTAYRGVQNRAQDSRRVNDLKSIVKALELYKIDNGVYPTAAGSGLGLQQGWETSAREAPGEFIAALKFSSYGFEGGVPIDPVNNATEDLFVESRTNLTYSYYYVRYTAGSYGCDATKGQFYVLGAVNMGTTGMTKHPDSPGFICPDRNWGNEFSWATGGYTN